MKILTLLSPVFGISLKNTPPLNEVYEQVLRYKHDSQDGHEKLLLELSDMAKSWEKDSNKKGSTIDSLKTDLNKIRKTFDNVESAISNNQMDTKALSKSMELVVNELQAKMDLANESIDTQLELYKWHIPDTLKYFKIFNLIKIFLFQFWDFRVIKIFSFLRFSRNLEAVQLLGPNSEFFFVYLLKNSWDQIGGDQFCAKISFFGENYWDQIRPRSFIIFRGNSWDQV